MYILFSLEEDFVCIQVMLMKPDLNVQNEQPLVFDKFLDKSFQNNVQFLY